MEVFFGNLPSKPQPFSPEFYEEEPSKVSTCKLQDWIFDSEPPPEEVVQKLNDGLMSVGDHIMYRSQDTGRWAGAVNLEGKTWLARELTYWIADGKLAEGRKYSSIRAGCGEQKCIRPDHAQVRYDPSKKVKNPKKAKPKLAVERVQGPPVYVPPPKPKLTGKSKTELLAGDRTKCPSAKVFYETLKEVQAVAAYYNTHFRQPGEHRLYGYDCDWCSGNHLTHQNPKTRKAYKHKGSWA